MDLLWPSTPYPRIEYLPCIGWVTIFGYEIFSIPAGDWRKLYAGG